MDTKYYSEKQVYMSAFWGGPIPPGILIYKNFKRVGDDMKASLSLAITFIFTILLFYGIMQLPDAIADKIPNLVFTALYTGIVYLVYHRFLAEKINDKINNENKVSNWNVAGLTVLGLVTNLIIIFAMAMAQPAFPGEKIVYGDLQHEVFFDAQDYSAKEANDVAKVLYNYEYFQADFTQSVRLEKIGDVCKLRLPLDISLYNDPDVMTTLHHLKADLSVTLSKNVVIVVESYELTGDTNTKEI